MFSNLTIYLQRLGVAFGMSLALVSAVAAQTTTDLEQAPTYDPASAGYGFRIGVNNFVTGVVDIFNDEAAAQRRIDLSDDYVRQCNKYKHEEAILARVVERKEALDGKLEAQANALPTLKDEVARQFAEQRAVLLAIKTGAPGQAAARLGSALNGVTIAEAQLTGKRGLPPEAEAELAKFLSPAELSDIKNAANTNWAEGFKRFNALIAGKPGPFGNVLETAFHAGDFKGHGGRVFGPGGPPPELLKQFENAGDIAKFGFLQDPQAAERYADHFKTISGDIKFDFNDKKTEFAKYLPPEQLQRYQDFHNEIKAQFGDPSKFDPTKAQAFFKDFDARHVGPLPGFGGPGGDYRGGYQGGKDYPQPKPGETQYQYQPNQQPSTDETHPDAGHTGAYQTQTYQYPQQSTTTSTSPAPTSTTPPSSQTTTGQCPTGYTGTYPNCVLTQTSNPTPTPTHTFTPH